jgi:hypothetical protein
MAITLNPQPANLGIVAPVLGPWFSQNVVLPAQATGQALRLPINFAGATDWLPPATGTLSLFVATPGNPPAPIAHLQDGDGNWPFPNGRFVAYFRLLPEVEARLDELMRLLPAATANPVTNPPTVPGPASTRARVRALALVLQLPALTDVNVLNLFTGPETPPGDDNNERIQALGLALTGGTNVVNGQVPMTWLRRPGIFNGNQDRMLVGLTGAADLWAFDHRGRAVDAGAVASWWSWLLSAGVGDDPATGATDYQLLAPGINAGTLPVINGLPAVANAQAGLTVHLVDAHEGALGAPFLNDRLQSGGSAVTANLLAASNTTGQAFVFSNLTPPGTTPPPDNPQVDNAPLARMAVLPDGNYGTAANVWPGGPVHAGLARDFVRVAVVEEESHLLGVSRRDSRQAPASEADRRASSQNRPSTRTPVSRTAGVAPVLLATADAASTALLQVFAAGNPTRAVLGVADLAWGPTPAGLATIAAAPAYPPNLSDNAALPAATYRVRALAGGGTSSETQQAVLVEVNLGNAAFAGAWVRAWPLGFDLGNGLHFRLTGGGGRVDATGVARLVMTLANGRIDASGLLGMDTIVAHLDNNATVVQRSYADRRFTRPTPDPGAAANAGAFGGGTSWVICETGQTGNGALPNGSVPPGGTVVVLSNPPAIVDRTTIPAAAWQTAGTLGGTIQVGDIVSLTETSFQSTPDRADALGRPMPRQSSTGDPTGGLGGVPGVITHRVGRAPFTGDILASSAPYALQDRLEVAAARTQGAGAPVAVIGGAPPLPWVHEVLPHYLGHPGAPAAIEIHGTGVALDGPPAVAVAEYVRERTAGLGFNFVQTANEPERSVLTQSELAIAAEAATPLPAGAASNAAGSVVAVLRTGPVGQDGFLGAAVGAIAANLYPFSRSEDQLEDWLDATFNDITTALGTSPAGQQLRAAAAGPIDSMTRGLDRRIQTAGFGAREVAISLAAAFARAQDLVYIETPALDSLVHGPIGEALNLWQILLSRMAQRRGLRLVVCVPTLLLPGAPRMLQAVRDAALLDALDAMRATAGDRVAVFSPGAGAGRAVRLATTTVVVDDVLAITGTTHLWRRGLTWDSSLAAAVFDERVVDGRSAEVRAFRMQLLGDRLGLPVTRVPVDAAELVRAIRDFDERNSVRRSATAIVRPATAPTSGDQDTWNPDGTETGITFSEIATRFAAAIALTDTDHAIVEG